MKSKNLRVARLEPPPIDKALAQRPGTVEIVHTVVTRFYRKGRIPGLSEGPEFSRVAIAEYHRT